MNRKISFFFVFFVWQTSFASELSLNCTFHGLKKNEGSIDFGTVSRLMDSRFDFDIQLPKTKNKEWSAFLEKLRVSGSVETPEKGWVGLALISSEKPTDGFACVKEKKGQTLVLTKTLGELTVHAKCLVR